jgi:hypothetical protein
VVVDLNKVTFDLGIDIPDGYVDKSTIVSDDYIIISMTRCLRVIDVSFVKGYHGDKKTETGEQSAPKKRTKKGKGRDVEEKDTPVPVPANQQPAKKDTSKQAKGRADEQEGTPDHTHKSSSPPSKAPVVDINATPATTPEPLAASQPVKPKPKPRPIPIKKAHRQPSPPAIDDDIEILDEEPQAAASSPHGACISHISFRISADYSIHSCSY